MFYLTRFDDTLRIAYVRVADLVNDTEPACPCQFLSVSEQGFVLGMPAIGGGFEQKYTDTQTTEFPGWIDYEWPFANVIEWSQRHIRDQPLSMEERYGGVEFSLIVSQVQQDTLGSGTRKRLHFTGTASTVADLEMPSGGSAYIDIDVTPGPLKTINDIFYRKALLLPLNASRFQTLPQNFRQTRLPERGEALFWYTMFEDQRWYLSFITGHDEVLFTLDEQAAAFVCASTLPERDFYGQGKCASAPQITLRTFERLFRNGFSHFTSSSQTPDGFYNAYPVPFQAQQTEVAAGRSITEYWDPSTGDEGTVLPRAGFLDTSSNFMNLPDIPIIRKKFLETTAVQFAPQFFSQLPLIVSPPRRIMNLTYFPGKPPEQKKNVNLFLDIPTPEEPPAWADPQPKTLMGYYVQPLDSLYTTNSILLSNNEIIFSAATKPVRGVIGERVAAFEETGTAFIAQNRLGILKEVTKDVIEVQAVPDLGNLFAMSLNDFSLFSGTYKTIGTRAWHINVIPRAPIMNLADPSDWYVEQWLRNRALGWPNVCNFNSQRYTVQSVPDLLLVEYKDKVSEKLGLRWGSFNCDRLIRLTCTTSIYSISMPVCRCCTPDETNPEILLLAQKARPCADDECWIGGYSHILGGICDLTVCQQVRDIQRLGGTLKFKFAMNFSCNPVSNVVTGELNASNIGPDAGKPVQPTPQEQIVEEQPEEFSSAFYLGLGIALLSMFLGLVGLYMQRRRKSSKVKAVK